LNCKRTKPLCTINQSNGCYGLLPLPKRQSNRN
jgi:hypothetical protein